MAKMTNKQADDLIFGFIDTYVAAMERHLNYKVVVYWPGIDAPRIVDKTRIYLDVERTTRKKPFGIEAGTGSLVEGTTRVDIYGTEEKSDFSLCTATADSMSIQLTRRRCGPHLVMRETTWEDTEIRYGRRIWHVVIEYEYES